MLDDFFITQQSIQHGCHDFELSVILLGIIAHHFIIPSYFFSLTKSCGTSCLKGVQNLKVILESLGEYLKAHF